MPDFVAEDFRSAVAQRLEAEHAALATRWLARLTSLLPLSPSEVFPTDSLLDHIPELIAEIARYVETPEREAFAANTQILSKARELGVLRHAQRASVHQVMREYRLLDAVLHAFVRELAEVWDAAAPSAEVVAVASHIHHAVDVLQETTVASFIARYHATVTEQARRLEAFNRMVGHELRQPLGTLQFALRLLDTGEDRKSEDAPRLLALVRRNVARLVELTGNLARLSGLSEQADDAQVQHVSIAAVAREVARQLREMADARGVAIEVDDGLPQTVVDVAALELALINLVSNAIKYSDPAKPARQVTIARGRAAGSVCAIDVRDNGLGIPQAHLPHILERPVRAHADLDEQLGVDGLGLGLVIVRDCLRALDGRISVSSEAGVGTTFTVEIPLREAPPAPGRES